MDITLKMEPDVRNYQINHIFQQRDSGKYCWTLRERKARSTITPGTARAVEEMFMRKLPRTSQIYLEIMVPYLNNPAEETVLGSNNIKEQHETMKLRNEEVMLS